MVCENNWIGQKSPWSSYSWLDQEIYEQLQSKVYVFSDSLLCLVGKSPPHPRSGEIWEQERIAYFVASKEYQELFDNAGEPVVFEWRIFPGHTTAQVLQEVQKMTEDEKVSHHFKGRIIFMSM